MRRPSFDKNDSSRSIMCCLVAISNLPSCAASVELVSVEEVGLGISFIIVVDLPLPVASGDEPPDFPFVIPAPRLVSLGACGVGGDDRCCEAGGSMLP